MRRGDIWWATLPAPFGSEPGYERPFIVVSDDAFNDSPIRTILAVVVTTNARLAFAPGNVELPAGTGGLKAPSVANVSQIVTLDKSRLRRRIGRLPPAFLAAVDAGLRLVLRV